MISQSKGSGCPIYLLSDLIDDRILTYPDNTFDLSITVMAIMMIPDAEKAFRPSIALANLEQHVIITSRYPTQHIDIVIRVFNQPHHFLSTFIKEKWII